MKVSCLIECILFFCHSYSIPSFNSGNAFRFEFFALLVHVCMAVLTDKLHFWGFILFKVPLLLFCFPRILLLSTSSIIVRIPLYVLTKNHLGSMYFGALMMGADLAGGLLAFKCMRHRTENFSLVFKDTSARFLKRPDYGVNFCCNDGDVIEDLMNRVVSQGARADVLLRIEGHCSKTDEIVAEFTLTLSMKEI